ncbi:MAG: metallophosphoesterase [Coprothermobacterota bacterium]|nr:metallophosphoesterase [Coprothermobacterota bacterium]
MKNPRRVVHANGLVAFALVFCFTSFLMLGTSGLELFGMIPLAFSLASAFLLILVRSTMCLHVERVEVSLPGAKDQKRPYRIAFFADLHLGKLKGRAWLEHVVEAVNAEQPDLILIGGDFLYKMEHAHLRDTFEPLRQLHATDGVYAVLGNHDYGYPGPNLSAPLEFTLGINGVQLLRNEHVLIRGRFVLAGIDDLWSGRADFRRTVQGVPTNLPFIFLAHNPGVFKPRYLRQLGLDQCEDYLKKALWLFGHTHGGQLFPRFLRDLFYRFDRGFYPRQEGTVFITQGAGEVGLNGRFSSRPELAVLEVSF